MIAYLSVGGSRQGLPPFCCMLLALEATCTSAFTFLLEIVGEPRSRSCVSREIGGEFHDL